MEKTIDRTELFAKYQNKWVALTDDDKFIVSGATLDEVLTEAKKKGFDNPVTTKIPDLKFEFIL
jgi:hypothetical protein